MSSPIRIVRLVGTIPIYIRHWREPVQTRDGLPLEGNEPGDARLVLDENAIYVWTGSQWIKVTNRLFTDLADTPDSYTGNAGKYLKVKSTEDGLEFASAIDTFTGLLDTPDSYAGYAGQLIRVKSTEDGLEFIDHRLVNKPSVVVPKDFTDIQEAINYVYSKYGGGIVYLEPGEYNVDSTIVLKNGVSLIGLVKLENEVGMVYPKLIAGTSPVLTCDSYYVTTPIGRTEKRQSTNAVVANLEIDGRDSYQTGIGGTYICYVFYNLAIHNFTGYGMAIDGYNSVISRPFIGYCDVGISLSGTLMIVRHGIIRHNRLGIHVLGLSARVVDNEIRSNREDGILVEGYQSIIARNTIVDNDTSGVGAAGVKLSGQDNILALNTIGNYSTEQTQDYGVYEVDGQADYNIIVSNILWNHAVENMRIVGPNTIIGLNIER